jgi:hypothetical protein
MATIQLRVEEFVSYVDVIIMFVSIQVLCVTL